VNAGISEPSTVSLPKTTGESICFDEIPKKATARFVEIAPKSLGFQKKHIDE